MYLNFTCKSCVILFPITSVAPCTDPGSIENGEMEGSPPFTCVSTVKYTCNEGYWLLGAEILRCRTDARWDNPKPVCIDKSKKCVKSFQFPFKVRFKGALTSAIF